MPSNVRVSLLAAALALAGCDTLNRAFFGAPSSSAGSLRMRQIESRRASLT